MITIEAHDNGRWDVYDQGEGIGYVSARIEPFHARTCHLELALARYDPAGAKELFGLLRTALARPLQVMLPSRDAEKCAFLAAGGFQRKRRCYEVEAGRQDLLAPIKPSVPLAQAARGDPAFESCGALLYESYALTHATVSPLTADRASFYRVLPDMVLFSRKDGGIVHYAFVDGNEIAYIGTVHPPGFPGFAQTLLSRMLEQHGTVRFECDDCDPAAMALRTFFRDSGTDTYDTYILI